MSVTDYALRDAAKEIAEGLREAQQPKTPLEERRRIDALSMAERFVASVNSARSFASKIAPPETLKARDVLNVAQVFEKYLATGEVPDLGAPDEAAT